MVKTSGPMPVKAKISAPVRALDTVYQNTTGRPILCVVSVRCLRESSVGASAFVRCKIDTDTPPLFVHLSGGLAAIDNKYMDGMEALVFAVPPGYYYMVETDVVGATSYVVLSYWREVEL